MISSRKAAVLLVGTIAGCASPGGATPGQVCDLLKPFFEKPPSHFESQRGIKTADQSWDSKSNPLAEALNAKCGVTKSAGRIYFECETKFEKDQIDAQAAFFRDVVIGVDFCLGNLDFGNAVRRVASTRNDADSQSQEVEWFKTIKKGYVSGAEFGADVRSYFFKSTNNRDVDLKLFYEPEK